METIDLMEQCPNINVKENQASLFNNELLSDIEFRFDDGVNVFGHKTILSAASSVFYDKFFGTNATTKKTLHVCDYLASTDDHFPLTSSIFTEVLRFIYTGKANLCLDIIPPIMDAAYLFRMKNLEDFCFDFLNEKRLWENIIAIYERCFNLNNNLTKHCLTLFDAFFNGIMQTPEFLKQMTLTPLLQLIKRDTLNVPEIMLFKGLLIWSQNTCKQRGLEIDFKGLRTTFAELFELVRFPTMTWKEFIECNKNVPNFFTPQEFNDIFHFIRNGVKKDSLKFSTVRRRNEVTYRVLKVVDK